MKTIVLCALLLTACASADAEDAKPSLPIEIEVVQKIIPVVCMSYAQFKNSIARVERLVFFGTLPSQGYILEIYSAQPSAFTIVIRDQKLQEVCIIAHGSELVPVAPFLESHYKVLR